MSARTFIEKDDTKFSQQLTQFADRLPTYSSTVGVTTAEKNSATADALFFAFILSWLVMFRDFATQATAYKDNARKGIVILTAIPVAPEPDTAPAQVSGNIQKRFSDLAGRIKKSPNYTPAIGRDLGIVAPSSPFVPGDGKPVLTVKLVEGGFPQIKYKKGKYSGAKIEKEKGGEWDLVTISTPPKFIDRTDFPATGQSKIVKYRAIYMYKGVAAGQYSEVFTITVTG